MKSIIIILFFCAASISVNAQDTTCYENGQIYLIEKWVNGKRSGEQKVYYRSGQLWEIGKWTNGMQTGKWKLYHENGRLEQIGKYHISKYYNTFWEYGKWKSYYESGKIKDIMKWKKNGDRKGKWKSYYENGRVSFTSRYIGGYLWGKCKYYDGNGKLIRVDICY